MAWLQIAVMNISCIMKISIKRKWKINYWISYANIPLEHTHIHLIKLKYTGQNGGRACQQLQ